ncbi:hypothetical protein VF21_06880 [Pseudogymnoascus sp. 05NY08]|nr:hypothetical protein VF21_06880 [Pseudogymnoascus sp. 05NY08]
MKSRMGLFLLTLTKQERHKGAWEVIEYHEAGNHEAGLFGEFITHDFYAIIARMIGAGRRIDFKTIEPAIMESFTEAVVFAEVSVSYWIAKRNVTLVTIILMTASLNSELRKKTVTQMIQAALPHFSGGESPMTSWYHFQCNMKAIDYLAAPNRFEDAVIGLVLLFPDDFNWSLRGKLGSDSNEKMKKAATQAVQRLPKLLEIALELTPQAKKIGVDTKLYSFSTETNPASSAGPSERRAPRSGAGVFTRPQRPISTTRGVSGSGLGKNESSLPGGAFPIVDNTRDVFGFSLDESENELPLPEGPLPVVDNTPSQSKSTAMNISSLLS